MLHNQHITDLGALLESKEIKHVIIAPGSRNAPLIQLFTSKQNFVCYSVVDERSAGYMALGMARELKEPVVLVTTSGTAVLNLSPAVAEAFHQHIPLILLTADRPLERINQFNNQAINQEVPYFNHSKGFFELPLELRTETEAKQAMFAINQLIEESMAGEAGPVHINIPLLEPLYEKLPEALLEIPDPLPSSLPEEEMLLADPEICQKKIMVLAGMGMYEKEVGSVLMELCTRFEVLVIAENISNLASDQFISNPELVLAGSNESEREQLGPEVVISFGGQVVSKRLKLFIEAQGNAAHYEIRGNILRALKRLISSGPEGEGLSGNPFLANWKTIESRELVRAESYLHDAPFTNLSSVHQLLSMIPAHATVHLGNSSVIRYSNLSPMREDLNYYSNRGTSGIDGSVSAAAGAAMVSDSLHVLLVGDLSFVYDSNALWNRNFPPNLKIVVINDGGGGIFRLLDGPDRMEFFEEFSVTHHPVSLELLSQSFGREHKRAENMEELISYSKLIFDRESSLSILEVDTTGSENSRIFKEFFNRNQ